MDLMIKVMLCGICAACRWDVAMSEEVNKRKIGIFLLILINLQMCIIPEDICSLSKFK
jgi:hypothetical protein